MSEHGHGAGEHEHHEVADALRGGVDEGTGAPGDATTEQLMAQAVGGWRGMLDSSLPSALFLVVYVVDGQQLAPAVWTAVAAGVLMIGLILGGERVSQLETAVAPDGVGTALLVVAQLLFLPNLLAWSASWVLGAGFSVGVGSFVSPLLTLVGLLPAVPVFGAVPQPGGGSGRR